MIKLHNTLTRAIDEFKPQEAGKVKLYTCGPTVYDFLHVGNWTAYIYWDTLVRMLRANKYDVERVMNITDVGHLTSDADEGEDKLEKGAKREGKTAWEIAEFYGNDFIKGMERLNLVMPEHITKATEFIPEQLELVRTLHQKGYTYQISDGIYFDTAKFPSYADFAQLDLEAQRAGARVTYNDEKRNPSDFALWKFTPAGEKRDMEWETPADLLDSHQVPARVVVDDASVPQTTHADARQGESEHRTELYPKYSEGEAEDSTQHSAASNSRVAGFAGQQAVTVGGSVMGFPGWHLECSAMAMSILGHTLDIHTGGIDHIPVHHTNEIAQSEAASGARFSNYWLHNNHMKVNGTKISKSLQNGYTLDDLAAKGFSPMDFRMFALQSHYRSEGNFTFENLEAAHNRLQHWRTIATLRHQVHDTLQNDDEKSSDDKSISLLATSQAIIEALNDDLNTPEALKIIDEAFAQIESKPLAHIHQQSLEQLLETIDDTLGLAIRDSTPDITDQQKQLILQRQRVREEKDWAESDKLRDQLAQDGIIVKDTAGGSVWEYSE
jgi:cysteinyl-tRNA synthetase